MEFVEIGNVRIERTAALAPMASVADRAYRLMCKKFGAAYLVSEMISSKGLCFGDRKTARLCEILPEERPMALQIFGEEPAYMAKAAYLLGKYEPDIIDINMGCPVPKIVGNGSGSALMKEPKLAGEIIRETVKNAPCPVTVKIRAGWSRDNINAVEIAKTAEQAGAAAIAVHGRTRDQYYTGKADRGVIRDVKRAVSCPVIGNGDVFSAKDREDMLGETGCDLVMIGRGSCGRPWIFREIKEYCETGELPAEPDIEEKMAIMLEHARLLCGFKGEIQGMKEMRKNVAWYIKGMPGAAKIRGESGNLSEYSALEETAQELIRAARK